MHMLPFDEYFGITLLVMLSEFKPSDGPYFTNATVNLVMIY